MKIRNSTLSIYPLKFLFFFFLECYRVSPKFYVIYQLLMKAIVGDMDYLVQLANVDDIIYNINK